MSCQLMSVIIQPRKANMERGSGGETYSGLLFRRHIMFGVLQVPRILPTPRSPPWQETGSAFSRWSHSSPTNILQASALTLGPMSYNGFYGVTRYTSTVLLLFHRTPDIYATLNSSRWSG